MTIVVVNQLPPGSYSTLFPDKPAAVADLRAGAFLMAAQNALPGVTVSDDYLYGKLLAAEKEVSRLLKVYLVPTVIIPDDAPQAEVDALEAGQVNYAQEGAYDYDPDFFHGDRWGFIVTQSRPIISVASIQFAYPQPNTVVFTVPTDWIRLNKKYGQIQLVPASSAFTAPLSAFLLQAMGGGRTIPFMVRVRYTAGLKNAATEWPDVVDVIKRKAMLKIVMDAFVPQSGSISADGLSQSMSLDFTKYGEAIDDTLFGPKGQNSGLMTAIHGIRVGGMG